MTALPRVIGIGNAEPGEHAPLERFHALSPRPSLLVIEAEEMQNAVRDEMGEMIGEGLALLRRLARHRLVGEHDIAQEHGPAVARRTRRSGRTARSSRCRGRASAG